MFGIENYPAFLAAGILLNLTPGQDTMYIIGRSLSQGKYSGIASALGIGTGSVVHTLAAAFGLNALLATSALAFDFVKYAGAAYLVFLGLQMIFAKSNSLNNLQEEEKKINFFSVYRKGILTNILNPKVALFYLAFLPQFVNPANEYGALPFIILGLTFVITGTLWCIVIALFSSYFSEKLRRNLSLKKTMNRLSGILFIILGIKIALQRR
ncbi:MAG: LysE family translocator [Bacteroidia bacterium]